MYLGQCASQCLWILFVFFFFYFGYYLCPLRDLSVWSLHVLSMSASVSLLVLQLPPTLPRLHPLSAGRDSSTCQDPVQGLSGRKCMGWMFQSVPTWQKPPTWLLCIYTCNGVILSHFDATASPGCCVTGLRRKTFHYHLCWVFIIGVTINTKESEFKVNSCWEGDNIKNMINFNQEICGVTHTDLTQHTYTDRRKPMQTYIFTHSHWIRSLLAIYDPNPLWTPPSWLLQLCFLSVCLSGRRTTYHFPPNHFQLNLNRNTTLNKQWTFATLPPKRNPSCCTCKDLHTRCMWDCSMINLINLKS